MTVHQCRGLVRVLVPLLVLTLPVLVSGARAGELETGAMNYVDPHPSTHLFGNWGGIRDKLKKEGIDLNFSYLSETMADVAGGKSQGITYAGQEEAKAVFHWDKIAGIKGLTTHVIFVNRNGRDLSRAFVGDDLIQAQEIYGGGGDVVVHFVEAFAVQKLANGRVTLKGGRLAVMNDFGNLPASCKYFMALTLCATRPLDIDLGWTVFPRSTWGTMVKGKIIGPLTMQLGVYEVNKFTGGRSGFHWTFDGTRGAMIPFEIDLKPKIGPDKLSGIYKIGAFLDTAQFINSYIAINGLPEPLTTAPPERSNRTGFYMMGQQRVWKPDAKSKRGLSAIFAYIHNDPENSIFENSVMIGMFDEGPFPSRPHDSAAIQFGYFRVSSNLTAAQQLEQSLGEPLSFNAPGVQTHEMYVEANYNIAVYRGIKVMPDLQYVIRPSATSRYPNAWLIGFQVSVDF